MAWTLVSGNFGFCGDSYGLISTEYATRDEAWKALFALADEPGISADTLLVLSPSSGLATPGMRLYETVPVTMKPTASFSESAS